MMLERMIIRGGYSRGVRMRRETDEQAGVAIRIVEGSG